MEGVAGPSSMDKCGRNRKIKHTRQDRSIKLRGYMKKKATFFPKQKVNKVKVTGYDAPVCDIVRPCQRHERNYFDLFTKTTHVNEFSIPAADGLDGSAIVLRPKHHTNDKPYIDDRAPPSGRYNMHEGNIIFEKSRLLDLINNCTRTHQNLGTCNDLNWDIVEIEPWGLFSSVVLKCTSCKFESERTKLYEEVGTHGPGRKAAAGNARLQLLLQDMPIGPTELQLIFAAVGLRAGSLAGMQKLSYKAAELTEEVAAVDMRKWREVTKQILKDRGCSDPNQISAAFDVRYHGMFRGSNQTPGPGAVQATATCVETVTPKKKCIAIDNVNKICLKGSRMKGNGNHIICGHTGGANHDGCTANQPYGRAIRECDMAERIAEDILKTSDISITHLCTDSDATGRNAFETVNQKSGKCLPPLTWYKDLTHVSRNMRKKILSYKFDKQTFGLKKNGTPWNSKELLDCRKALALDIPERVAITLWNITQYWRGNVEKIKSNIELIVAYMLVCYDGQHATCNSAPLARLTGCAGEGKGRCWFSRSSSLSAQGISKLNLSATDYDFVLSVVSMKLSRESIGYFTRRETTSRCESINRAISKGCPKNRLFARTATARVCSAIGRQNNNFHDFLQMKFRAMKCSLPHDNIGQKIIRKYQRKRELTYASQTKSKYANRKRALASEHRNEYFIERLKSTNVGAYHKYQLDSSNEVVDSAMDTVHASKEGLTSCGSHVSRALQATIHRKEVLSHAKHYNMNKLQSRIRANRLRRKAIKTRNKSINKARTSGPVANLTIRNEHSYGSLV